MNIILQPLTQLMLSESQNSEWNHAIFSELYRLSHKREINEIILPTLNKGVERQTFEDLFEKFKNKCKLYLFKIFKFFKKIMMF